MKKKIMPLIIILGLASLSAAQTNPQNIINAKISEGYYALYLTEGVISADVLWQNPTLENRQKMSTQQQGAKEYKIAKNLSQVHKEKSGRLIKRNDFKTCNMRTVYN
jgi:hypothetical protein